MRLLSYNIHKGFGGLDRRYQLARVRDVIEAQNADFVCLQEVTRNALRTRGDDQAAFLSERLGLPHKLYQMNVHYKVGGYGNLLLSRWPLVYHHHISLTLGGRIRRGAQLALVHTPEGALHLVHSHLGLGARERHWQVGHLLEHRLYRHNAHIPTMVLGDFNDWRNRLDSRRFAEHGLVQITRPVIHFRSFPAFAAVGSLDKAFQRGLTVTHAQIVRTRATRQASDHLPLLIDFHIEPPPGTTGPAGNGQDP